MTKQEFIEGKTFGFPRIFGKYAYRGEESGELGLGIMVNVGINLYEANVEKIGSKTFTAFTFVLNKKVTIKARYEDLTLYVPKDK
jgi:hypothetical protein